MTISLYDLSVPTFLQTLNALADILHRADEHCAKTSHDPNGFSFFYRYNIDLTQLFRFENPENSKWLRDPSHYWHERMFGEAG
jgi:hypothetical protein